jgi:hypothetical protein
MSRPMILHPETFDVDDLEDVTERFLAGVGEPPTLCDVCGEVIPSGVNAWYDADVDFTTCTPCEMQLRRAQREDAARIRAEYEPGEDELENRS